MGKRRTTSLGVVLHNPGRKIQVDEKPLELDHSREYYIFDVVPMGAVRMSSSDRWKVDPNHPDPDKRQRPKVTKYFSFRDKLRAQARKVNFALPEVFEVIFCVPMPESWSQKKKERMAGMPCKTLPDVDNYLKALMDTLSKSDGYVWCPSPQKRYAYNGSIIIYT